jgi:hypothetical protein
VSLALRPPPGYRRIVYPSGGLPPSYSCREHPPFSFRRFLIYVYNERLFALAWRIHHTDVNKPCAPENPTVKASAWLENAQVRVKQRIHFLLLPPPPASMSAPTRGSLHMIRHRGRFGLSAPQEPNRRVFQKPIGFWNSIFSKYLCYFYRRRAKICGFFYAYFTYQEIL